MEIPLPSLPSTLPTGPCAVAWTQPVAHSWLFWFPQSLLISHPFWVPRSISAVPQSSFRGKVFPLPTHLPRPCLRGLTELWGRNLGPITQGHNSLPLPKYWVVLLVNNLGQNGCYISSMSLSFPCPSFCFSSPDTHFINFFNRRCRRWMDFKIFQVSTPLDNTLKLTLKLCKNHLGVLVTTLAC